MSLQLMPKLSLNVSRLCSAVGTSRFSTRQIEPFAPIHGKKPKFTTAADAIKQIKSNDKVYVHAVAATPTPLLNALCDHAKGNNLKGIQLYHIHVEGEARWVDPSFDGVIRSNCFFISANTRKAVNEGRADCMAIFLSEIPILFRRNIIDLDCALLTVSPPDPKGYCSLGTSVDVTRAALQNAKHVIAMTNPKMPRTLGDGMIHISHIDEMIEGDWKLPEGHSKGGSEGEKKIGQIIASQLIEDGATLQMGIGSIPDAVLAGLKNHKDLGVHTEMFSDGIIDLVENGAINNSQKKTHPGKIVSSFSLGSRRLYDFMHDNPMVFMGDVEYTNNPAVIRKNPKVSAINSAIEIDITGQICADSIGSRMYSGVGGQIDFIRGAALSNDGRGKPIIALESVTKRNESKIVPVLKNGAGIVTTRAHAHYVVTENGIAYLFGKTARQRAYELIKIANTGHQQALEKAAFERLKCMPSP